jgi:long-subunit acyl-CoA synthetase (AMP-forming)
MPYTKDNVPLHAAYHWEKSHPDKQWLTQPMGGGKLKELTWKQGMDEARRMAAHLRSLDLPPKSHIALFSKNSAWWLLADLAIWMAGHVTIPLYPTLTPETIRQILDHSESKLIFVGKLDGFKEMEPGLPDGMPRIRLPLSPESSGDHWDDIIAKTDPMTENTERQAEEMATIIYTSGSTGIPKGVMHSFERMGIAARGVARDLDINDRDRMLSYLPLAHVFERWIVEQVSYFVGTHLFFAESLDTFVQDLNRARPTLFVSVPRLWQKFQLGVFQKMPPERLALLLKIPIINGIIRKKILTGLGLDQARFAGSGSAPIPGELIQWYRDLGLELLEGYGMTENLAYSHVSRPGQVRVGYVGSPYDDVECKISEEGEILVKSPADMLGYYKSPEESKAAFTEDGFLKTGDRGEIDSQGRLRITGRVKELFKTSKGKYVAPAPIENKIQVHDAIEMVCVAGNGQPQPHGIIMLSEAARENTNGGDKTTLEASLKAHLEDINAGLDHHEKLAFLAVVSDEWQIENGFLTPTMKLKRAKVDETYGGSVDGWYEEKQSVIWA